MLNPEATLKLINEGFWGAKAMEHRVLRCCGANPDCPFQNRCLQRYDRFVDMRDTVNRAEQPGQKRMAAIRLLNYHRMREVGIPSREAARRTTNKQTELALATLKVTTKVTKN